MVQSLAATQKLLVALGQEEGGITDKLTDELERVVAALQSNNAQLLDALCHPALSPNERKAVLESVLPKLNVQPLMQTSCVCCSKAALSFLPAIASDARRQADDLAGRARAVVKTATKMSASMEKEVKNTLESATGKTILLEAQIDPSLIGGMVAQVGGKVFDASVKTRLEELRQQLLDSNPTTPVGDA